MDVTPIPGAALGAVVHGSQVTGDLGSSQCEEIRAALDEHLVLVFRGHETPSYAEFLAFGSRFGYIPKTGLTSGAHPDHNEILIVSNLLEDGRKIGVGDAAWMAWHTDYSFRPRVSQVGFLEALEVPPSGGGQTLFTDMYALYDSLPPRESAGACTPTGSGTACAPGTRRPSRKSCRARCPSARAAGGSSPRTAPPPSTR